MGRPPLEMFEAPTEAEEEIKVMLEKTVALLAGEYKRLITK